MSFAGLKKQINKANQYVSEKIGGAKGTELDDDFVEMERKIDVTNKLVEEVSVRTQEYLQPNPASRAKLMTVNTFSKLRGQAKNALYPQPEGVLGETMIKHGKDLGDEAPFGAALVESGEAYKQLADIKYALEDNVRQNFLEPLHHLQTKDLKEVAHHRKKLQGRRLDFDCKKRKQTKEDGGKAGGATVTEEEIRMAEEKFDESKQLAETAMYNVLENDVEQISQLAAFIEAQIDYHRQAADTLATLFEVIKEKQEEAQNRPRVERIPKPRPTKDSISPGIYDHENNFGSNFSTSPMPTPTHQPNIVILKAEPMINMSTPCAKALFDFDPENEGELGFQENDIIKLTSRLDENWFEGEVHGRTGYFPVNYVDVLVDLH